MTNHIFSEIEKWLKLRDYKPAYLMRNNKYILVAFKKIVPTPIFAFCYELGICHDGRQIIGIGNFWKDSSGCVNVGFSVFADCQNTAEVTEEIQELQKETHIQTQIPYLDELMR